MKMVKCKMQVEKLSICKNWEVKEQLAVNMSMKPPKKMLITQHT
jgi:hypothetical protein